MKYKMPEINYIDGFFKLWDAIGENIDEFRNSLTNEDYFNKNFWEEALKQKHFMPLLAEFLYDQKDYEKLKQFLKDNFYEEIEKKVKEEIDRDLEILSSENPKINETSIIYTRNATFFNFFEGEEETIKKFGLNRFYDEKVFDNLIQNELDEVNLYLLASLVNFKFNGAFYSQDCKRVVGCLFDLDYFYDEETAKKLFINEILSKMAENVSEFYFIFDDEVDWCWVPGDYIDYKLKELLEDGDFRTEIIQTFYDWKDKLPWSIVESCDDLENIWDEDELEGIAENIGYESFEEMCEENL